MSTELAHPQPRLPTALHPRSRRPRATRLGASLTFAWRAMLKLKHVPEELGDVIGIPILFTLMFTYLFGGALAGSTHQYLQFLLPGTLVLAVVLVTIYTGVTLNTDLSTGVFDRYRAMPIWRPAPIIGGLIGDTARYLLASTLVIALGVIMGFDPHGGGGGILAAVGLLLAFAFALGWLWTVVGLIARSPRAIMSIGLTVLFPLTFASNVFVQPTRMPSWLRTFVHLNPVSHLVTAERGLIDGTATGRPTHLDPRGQRDPDSPVRATRDAPVPQQGLGGSREVSHRWLYQSVRGAARGRCRGEVPGMSDGAPSASP